MKAYKIVGRDLKGHLYSYHYVGQIRYFADGRTIYPEKHDNPFLFVFETLEYARGFLMEQDLDDNPYYEIWEVEADNIKLEIKIKENLTFLVGAFAPGTRFCDSLKMVKKMS